MRRITVKSRGVIKDIFRIVFILIILRLLPIVFGLEFSPDVVFFKRQAVPILNNQNIYQVTNNVFPYLPLTMFIPALCLLLSSRLNIPFYITMKIPPLIGDISLAIAIYYWLIRANNNRDAAFRGALLYAINPIVILIGAFQGNIMSLPTLFMFLAVMMAIYDYDKNYRLSALLLGLAIAFRSYPILLLPLILLKYELSFFKKLKYVAYAIVPAIAASIPFLYLDYKSMAREILGYSGIADYGPVAIARARDLYAYLSSYKSFAIDNTIQGFLDSFSKLYEYVHCPPAVTQLFKYSKVIFLLVYLILVLQYRRFNLLKLVLLIYLGFYFFYTGVSSQYLIWILPFLYFLHDKLSKWYVILGTYAIISCYLCYYPSILFGERFPVYNHTVIQWLLLNEFVALSLFWSLCGFWFFRLLFKKNALRANSDF